MKEWGGSAETTKAEMKSFTKNEEKLGEENKKVFWTANAFNAVCQSAFD